MFPGFNERPYSWQQGYIQGFWVPTARDKEPPVNPIVKGTKDWRDWEEGFQAAQQQTRKAN